MPAILSRHSPLYKPDIARPWQQENLFIQAFRPVPGCHICMCKRGLNFVMFIHLPYFCTIRMKRSFLIIREIPFFIEGVDMLLADQSRSEWQDQDLYDVSIYRVTSQPSTLVVKWSLVVLSCFFLELSCTFWNFHFTHLYPFFEDAPTISATTKLY